MRRTRTIIAAGTTALTVVAGSVAAGPVAAGAPAGAATSTNASAATASTSFTPGAAGHGDPYFPLAGNGGYDARHYDLRLAYDPAKGVLSGSSMMRARSTQNLSRFDLDLAGLTVGAVTVDGHPARFRRTGQELVVTPASGIRSGRTFSVTVHYAGVPAAVIDADGSTEGWVRTPDGAFVVGEPVGSMSWFPSNNAPSDKATYDLRMTVPKGISVWGNGVLRSSGSSGGRTTYWWHQPQPISTYLVTATLGRFERRTGRTRQGLPVYLAVDPGVKGTAVDHPAAHRRGHGLGERRSSGATPSRRPAGWWTTRRRSATPSRPRPSRCTTGRPTCRPSSTSWGTSGSATR